MRNREVISVLGDNAPIRIILAVSTLYPDAVYLSTPSFHGDPALLREALLRVIRLLPKTRAGVPKPDVLGREADGPVLAGSQRFFRTGTLLPIEMPYQIWEPAPSDIDSWHSVPDPPIHHPPIHSVGGRGPVEQEPTG